MIPTLLRQIIELGEKWNGENFVDWYRNINNILQSSDRLYTIEQALSPEPADSSIHETGYVYVKHTHDAKAEMTRYIMLASMAPLLRQQCQKMDLASILHFLRRNEKHMVSRSLFRCRMEEGTKIGDHILKWIEYMNKLEILGCGLNEGLAINLILQSLRDSYSQFVYDFIEEDKKNTLSKLLDLLKATEPGMKMSETLTLVEANSSEKERAQKSMERTVAERKGVCPHCGNPSHSRKHCKAFLEKGKKNVTFSSGTLLRLTSPVNI